MTYAMPSSVKPRKNIPTSWLLQGMGLSLEKIAKSNAADLNPGTLLDRYNCLQEIGVADRTIQTNYHLLSKSTNHIKGSYTFLRGIGFPAEKIATCAHLLQQPSQQLAKNYQHHIGLLRDGEERDSGRDLLRKLPAVLATSPETLEANFQYAAASSMDYRTNLVLMVIKPNTKREKMAWMTRELTPYRVSATQTRKELLREVQCFVREHPWTLTRSITALQQDRLSLEAMMGGYVSLGRRV